MIILRLKMMFEDIKVGDDVIISRTSWGGTKTIEKVTKVTPKYFDAGNRRFKKSDGYMYGNSDKWNTVRAEVATPEAVSQIKMNAMRANIVTYLTRHCNYSEVPIETLVQVYKLLKPKKEEKDEKGA